MKTKNVVLWSAGLLALGLALGGSLSRTTALASGGKPRCEATVTLKKPTGVDDSACKPLAFDGHACLPGQVGWKPAQKNQPFPYYPCGGCRTYKYAPDALTVHVTCDGQPVAAKTEVAR